MKAFEKWLKEDAPKLMPLRTEDRKQITLEEAMEHAWREALKKVLKDIEEGDLTESYLEDVLINVEKEIKEELES